METFSHRLLTELISGAGTELVTHFDLDEAVLPDAKFPLIFSEENTRVHYEDEAIHIDRPLSKDIFMVGSLSFDESVASYSMPINRDYTNREGVLREIRTHDSAVRINSVIRITLITDNEVPKQARGQLHYMQLFAMQAFMNPPTQDWWGMGAHVEGFTSTVNVPMTNVLGSEEELVIGKSFGVKFNEVLVRSEHLTLRRVT